MGIYYTDKHRYDDMINLPHHVSTTHPHMDRSVRAAQFAPFAALTGHREAIKNTEKHMEEIMAEPYADTIIMPHG